MLLQSNKKVLILSYYWPPSGGSGVQRWMYFAKYLKQFGWEPIVITVKETKASYPVLDSTLTNEVEGIRVIRTNTREPLRWYSFFTTGNSKTGIPQGAVNTSSFFGKLSAFIRGNFFIPDARKGWNFFAQKAAIKLLKQESVKHLITTGPPHSTHLVGIGLISKFSLNWWADFRDPWSDVFYNKTLFRLPFAQKKDLYLEKQVLERATGILTTVGGDFTNQIRQKIKGRSIVVLPNGFDLRLFLKVTSVPPKEFFHIVYTGLLTHNQAYNSLIAPLQNLSKKEKIRLSLAGNISFKIVKKLQRELPEVEVIDHGYLSHVNAIELMHQAHVLINFIFSGAETQMISGKLLEYLACKIPILSIGAPNTAAGTLLSKASYSVMLEENQPQEIEHFLEEIMDKKGQLKNDFPGLNDWSRETLTKRLIEEVLLN